MMLGNFLKKKSEISIKLFFLHCVGSLTNAIQEAKLTGNVLRTLRYRPSKREVTVLHILDVVCHEY